MAMTKEEKAAKRLKEQQEYEAQQREEREAFLLAMPKRLMDAQALASSCGVYTSVKLTENGAEVTFRDDTNGINDVIDYHSDCSEIEWLERQLNDLKAAQDARTKRRDDVNALWKDISLEDRKLLKEFIQYLQ